MAEINDIEWCVAASPVEYPDAIRKMEERVASIRSSAAPEMVWLLEHPPLYTAGTSAQDADLLDARFPVYPTGRGGQYTYHGPGQRVAYVMLDLKKRSADIRKYVWQLEEWIIRVLREFDATGERREGRVGIWVQKPLLAAPTSPEMGAVGDRAFEAKIAAIGVRLRKWVTYHGIAINVNPDLSHFGGIVPCGISDAGVTSLHALGRQVSLMELDAMLLKHFPF